MPEPQHRHIEELFERARALRSEEQLEFLEAACGEDRTLRGEVESLLEADRRARAEWATPDPLRPEA